MQASVSTRGTIAISDSIARVTRWMTRDAIFAIEVIFMVTSCIAVMVDKNVLVTACSAIFSCSSTRQTVSVALVAFEANVMRRFEMICEKYEFEVYGRPTWNLYCSIYYKWNVASQ